MGYKATIGESGAGGKPGVVEDIYKSNLVKGERAMSGLHPHNKKVPRTSDKGGRANQYGENRIIEGGGKSVHHKGK